MKLSNILGLNARAQLFTYRYNTRKGKQIADSKIQTARVLKNAGISHPVIYKKFRNESSIYEYNWNALPESFVLKPSRGFGGEGIVVVKKRSKKYTEDKPVWITTLKEKVTPADLKLHISDILEGAYSMGNVPDVAFIQEYLGRHKAFRYYSYRGTPDIRVIVFNKVPVMAMLRLPTKESGGRANLHQGAIGVGIDIATGITTNAILNGNQITHIPEKNKKLRGIKIPNWNQVLLTAINSQMVSGLGFLGVDIVLHPDKGPMVLELNAQPGLQIQLANDEGLKKRLERIEGLEVIDAEHGVKIAKAIFEERSVRDIKNKDEIRNISIWEEIKVVSKKKKKILLMAKVDTGAWRTSIDKSLAEKLGLLDEKNILWKRKIRTSLGKEERAVINLTYYLGDKKIATMASVSQRRHLRTPIILGRRDLAGFVVSPSYQDKPLHWAPKMWNK